MIAGWNARFQAAIDSGAPADIVWNQGLYSIEGWVVPKGSPKAEPARKFVAFCARAKQQAKFTEYLAYGPTNLKAYDFISEDRAKILPTSPKNLSKMSLASDPYWLEHRNTATERFNGWLLR